MRFGLIGFGAMGVLRARALKKTRGAELRMVVEPVAERRHKAAAEFGVRTSASVEDLACSADIDVVIVSTPPNLHAEHCLAALRAGKHVLCEEPLASTAEDCRRIVAGAREAGVTLGTGFNYRFYPAVAKARELIAAGQIGNVHGVGAFAGHPGGPEFTHHWVHDPSIMGGGALMDNGIHAADLTLHFLGEVAEATGFASDRVWGFGQSEDNGYVLMRTASGRVGTLHASWTGWSGCRFHVDVHGTAGMLRMSYPPMMTVLRERPAGVAKKGKRQVFLFPMMQIQERLGSYRWTVVESLIAEHLDFIGRISGRDGIGATGLDGQRAVELAYSAYQRKTGQRREVMAVADAQ